MEESFDVVQKHCSNELNTFQRCLLANPSNPSICEPHKQALSQCASSHIPLLAALKSRCLPQIQRFDECIQQNEGTQVTDEEMQKRCGGVLKDLWQCTEDVKAEMAAGDDKGGKS